MKDYAAIATQYARDVVDGRIAACKWVRLAGQRHLNDLARAADGWKYAWNPELRSPDKVDEEGNLVRPGRMYRPADRACRFIELLPHIKGEWAAQSQRIRLEPWQVFFVASIFGWVNVETRRRRFREADLFVPRKNGKSAIAAGIGLYMLTADNEFGAEVYSGATTQDQAGEVFSPAKLMARKTPDLIETYGVTVRETNISVSDTNSKFEPVIGKPGDGASPSCAIVDEYHEHATEALHDTMKTGMGARSQPLLLVITTSGDDVSGPCYAHQEDLQAVLEGTIENDQRFGVIYTIDQKDDTQEGDDWTTEAALIKANPNYGVSITPEFMLGQLAEAVRDARKQPTFQTKHLNIWVQSASPWLNLHAWKRLADKSLRIEDFEGLRCWGGMDLANVTDIASTCEVFDKVVDGHVHYYVFWRHYLPESTINEPDNKHYQGWARDGWITQTSGSMIDHDVIADDINKDADLVRFDEIAMDDWGSPGISARLQNDGFTVVRIPQVTKHLSAPMKFIDGLVKSGRIHHNGDPVAMWAVSNVTNKPDKNDNWFPRRPNGKKKIDPAAAMINAFCRAQVLSEPEDVQVYVL